MSKKTDGEVDGDKQFDQKQASLESIQTDLDLIYHSGYYNEGNHTMHLKITLLKNF
jgi:hypothetical protein